MSQIEKVAVLGAGLMGSQIAAQIANAGVPVVLLDIVPKDAADRNVIAKGAIEKLLKTDPAPFMTARAAKLITPGNLEDNLDWLRSCDWIVEAIVEKPDIKQALYRKVNEVRKPSAVVSSNTSTIPLAALTQGMPPEFTRNFAITHFFNPPRYMRLLELVPSEGMSADATTMLRDFCDYRLGKGVVMAKDTPGFIANRIGIFWVQAAINAAFDLGLTVEETDAVMGKPMGAPKTGVFALADLIGLDLLPLLAKSLLANLPPDDPYRAISRDWPLAQKMIADGYTGRKGKGGFFRLNATGGKKVKEAIDLKTGAYRPALEAQLASVAAAKGGLKAMLAVGDKGSLLAARVLKQGLAYVASLVPQISETVADIDQAMRLGFNWKRGPFEMIDQIGADFLVAELEKDKMPVPPFLRSACGKSFYRIEGARIEHLDASGKTYVPLKRPEGVLLLADIKRAGPPIKKTESAVLWDIGNGVLCLEFVSKMNTLDPAILTMIEETVAMIDHEASLWRALVVYNEGENFSAGANLGMALFALNIGLFDQIQQMVAQGQRAYEAIKYASFPVVCAPFGLAIGGGCEILLHAAAVQAHAESYIGLVETGVGLIPGWGGCTEMLMRAWADKKRPGGPMPPIARVFETLSVAKVAKSAMDAQELGFLRATDGITMNRDRLLADAKAKALALANSKYMPPAHPEPIALPGPTAKAALKLAVDGFRASGKATPHDEVVAGALAEVLSGGTDADITRPTSADKLRELERSGFMRLVHTSATLDRISHMLETGKPLRN